jgi:hypothetical protein
LFHAPQWLILPAEALPSTALINAVSSSLKVTVFDALAKPPKDWMHSMRAKAVHKQRMNRLFNYFVFIVIASFLSSHFSIRNDI